LCSSITEKGGTETLQALSLGADDYVTKPANGHSRDEIFQQLRQELILKINELGKLHDVPAARKVLPVSRTSDMPATLKQRVDILAIGISTGGPKALSTLLPKIAADFPVPIVIVQHMPPIFTELLAKSLTEKSAIKIIEAHDGDELLPGQALIAPGNYHMTVDFVNKRHIVRLNQDPTENFCRPAVDVLFRSVARQYGANTLALVMTGMGKDGQIGCRHIKEVNGQVLAQDETSCVVWGMPGAVVNAGLADGVYSLNELPQAIMQRVNQKRARL
jgi:two-component system chemotaxis response regulator CheB